MKVDLIKLNENDEAKYFLIFLRWIKNQGLYSNFLRAIKKKYTSHGYTYEVFCQSIDILCKRKNPDFINQLLTWHSTKDGWEYWFHINNQWRNYVLEQWHINIEFLT